MLYEDIHQRYGNHIAKRVRTELAPEVFAEITIDELLPYLEARAQFAHKEYQSRLDNPFINEELGDSRKEYMDVLYKRWCEAEDLAYLITIAEDVSSNARAQSSNSATSV
jgi:hypothetical protein